MFQQFWQLVWKWSMVGFIQKLKDCEELASKTLKEMCETRQVLVGSIYRMLSPLLLLSLHNLYKSCVMSLVLKVFELIFVWLGSSSCHRRDPVCRIFLNIKTFWPHESWARVDMKENESTCLMRREVVYMYEIKGRNAEALTNKVSLELRIQVSFRNSQSGFREGFGKVLGRFCDKFREGSVEVLASEIPCEGRFQERFRVGSEDSKEVDRRGTLWEGPKKCCMGKVDKRANCPMNCVSNILLLLLGISPELIFVKQLPKEVLVETAQKPISSKVLTVHCRL